MAIMAINLEFQFESKNLSSPRWPFLCSRRPSRGPDGAADVVGLQPITTKHLTSPSILGQYHDIDSTSIAKIMSALYNL